MMLLHNFKTKFVTLVILSAFLVGCEPIPIQNTVKPKPDLLSANTCTAPCFFGIIPGVTTISEAKSIVGQNSLFENCKDYDNTSQGGIRWFQCDTVWMRFNQNNIVTSVDFKQSNLLLSQIIQKYGSPDTVHVFLSNLLPDEPFKSTAFLLYDKVKIYVGLFEQNGTSFKISPDRYVTAVSFLSDDEYSQMAAADLMDFSATYTWSGYGEYSTSLRK